jgi:hypothetical protein
MGGFLAAIDILAGAIAGVLSNATGYLITGLLFHPYQAQTPHTWRAAETWSRYSTAAAVRIFACLAIAFLYAALTPSGHAPAASALVSGARFGALLWIAIAGPVILETALFVNWRRGFVVGLLLDWLVLCILAGLAAAMGRLFV